jgi:glycosyltransferase involved in cell wall biosynthesis
MPTYNYAHFILEAIESLRAQTYQNWECLVVDDGSTDSTAEVVARAAIEDGRVKLLQQENKRQAAAKNLGLQHSAGQYVQFLDADDRIESRKLECQVEYLESNPDVDIVYGGVRYFTTAEVDEKPHSFDDENPPGMPGSSGQGTEMVKALLRKNNLVINAALTRRLVVEEVGPFDEQLSPAEDWDYWLRCATAGKRFQYHDVDGVRALVRAHAASSSRNRVGMYRSMLLMRVKFGATTHDAELLALNREMMASDQGHLGVEEAVVGNLFGGLRGFLRAATLEQRPRWRAKWLICALAAPFLPKNRLRALLQTSLTSAVCLRRNSIVR